MTSVAHCCCVLAQTMPRRPWSAGTRLFSSSDYSSDSSSDSSSGLGRCLPASALAIAGDAGGVYNDGGSDDDRDVPAGALALPAVAAALRASRARTLAAQAKASR